MIGDADDQVLRLIIFTPYDPKSFVEYGRDEGGNIHARAFPRSSPGGPGVCGWREGGGNKASTVGGGGGYQPRVFAAHPQAA